MPLQLPDHGRPWTWIPDHGDQVPWEAPRGAGGATEAAGHGVLPIRMKICLSGAPHTYEYYSCRSFVVRCDAHGEAHGYRYVGAPGPCMRHRGGFPSSLDRWGALWGEYLRASARWRAFLGA